MVSGCPVMTSGISSLPEVGGNAAFYFNPSSPEDIAEKINSVIVSDTIRSEMRLRGFEQIKKFNKQDIAGQIMSGYRSIN